MEECNGRQLDATFADRGSGGRQGGIALWVPHGKDIDQVIAEDHKQHSNGQQPS